MDFYGFLENFCWLYGFVCVSAEFLWILSFRFMDFYGFLFFKWIMDFFRLGLCGGLGWWFEGAGILWFFGFLAFWDFCFHRLLSKRGSAGVGRTSSLYRNTRWPRRPLGKHWSAALKCDIFWPPTPPSGTGVRSAGVGRTKHPCTETPAGRFTWERRKLRPKVTSGHWIMCQTTFVRFLTEVHLFFRLLGPRFSKNMFKNFKFPDPQTSNPNHHINPCWFLWDLYWFLWCSGEFYWFLFFSWFLENSLDFCGFPKNFYGFLENFRGFVVSMDLSDRGPVRKICL